METTINPWFAIIIVLWIGACMGSFLNVCRFRLPKGEDIISKPSRCPDCGKTIPIWWNQPILGWLLLRGKCFHCKKPISIRYLESEAYFALLFGFIYLITLNPIHTILDGIAVGLLITWIQVKQQSRKLHGIFLTAAIIASGLAIFIR